MFYGPGDQELEELEDYEYDADEEGYLHENLDDDDDYYGGDDYSYNDDYSSGWYDDSD